jgi:hypothetical protein
LELRRRRLTHQLCGAGLRCQWRWPAKELDEPAQVLRGCGEQNLVPRAAQASQAKPVEPEDALHMRKSHLDLFALAARLLEGLGVGQRPDAVAHILVDISCDLANDRCRTLGFSEQIEQSFLLAL